MDHSLQMVESDHPLWKDDLLQQARKDNLMRPPSGIILQWKCQTDETLS